MVVPWKCFGSIGRAGGNVRSKVSATDESLDCEEVDEFDNDRDDYDAEQDFDDNGGDCNAEQYIGDGRDDGGDGYNGDGEDDGRRPVSSALDINTYSPPGSIKQCHH